MLNVFTENIKVIEETGRIFYFGREDGFICELIPSLKENINLFDHVWKKSALQNNYKQCQRKTSKWRGRVKVCVHVCVCEKLVCMKLNVNLEKIDNLLEKRQRKWKTEKEVRAVLKYYENIFRFT